MDATSTQPETVQKTFQLHPIGTVRREAGGVTLEIDPPYRDGLKQLDQFSHVMVFWWAEQLDDDFYRHLMTSEPPYAPGQIVGVFATRAPYRPNPVAMTTCELLDLDLERGRLAVKNLDAFDGTPVIDLKAYFPVCDRVRAAHQPAWCEGWPEWLPEEGIGLEEWEAQG